MLYLTQSLLFPWLILALALGLAVGWWSCRQTPRLEGGGGLWLALAAFGVGLFAAALLVVPGRPGLWLDIGLHLFGWYLAGCCLGCWLGRMGATDAEPELIAARSAAPAPSPAPVAMPEPARAASAPAASDPFQWQATKDGAGVTLTGDAPSAAARDAMLAAARTAFGALPVTAKLAIVPAAPAGIDRMAIAALGHLAALDRGVASLLGSRYTLTGLVGSADEAGRLRAAAGDLPAGFSLARAEIAVGEAAPPQAVPAATPSDAALPGAKPAGLDAPRGGKADDLKRIRGVGRQNERRLNGLGIWHFDQVAAWTSEEALWVGGYLAFPGRIEREGWVEQAKALATGDEAEAAKAGAQSAEAATLEGLPKTERRPRKPRR